MPAPRRATRRRPPGRRGSWRRAQRYPRWKPRPQRPAPHHSVSGRIRHLPSLSQAVFIRQASCRRKGPEVLRDTLPVIDLENGRWIEPTRQTSPDTRGRSRMGSEGGAAREPGVVIGHHVDWNLYRVVYTVDFAGQDPRASRNGAYHFRRKGKIPGKPKRRQASATPGTRIPDKREA